MGNTIGKTIGNFMRTAVLERFSMRCGGVSVESDRTMYRVDLCTVALTDSSHRFLPSPSYIHT